MLKEFSLYSLQLNICTPLLLLHTGKHLISNYAKYSAGLHSTIGHIFNIGKPTIYTQVKLLEYLTLPPCSYPRDKQKSISAIILVIQSISNRLFNQSHISNWVN